MNTEQEPQAQAGPEVVAEVRWDDIGHITWRTDVVLTEGTQLTTLQSHREAMEKAKAHAEYQRQSLSNWVQELSKALAKKDAALKACVEALETCNPGDYSTGHVIDPSFDEKLVDAAIAQAKEALK